MTYPQTPTLTSAQNDRVAGVLYGTAVGDALGAPYEFKAPVPADTPIVMHAGGGWELGEWTDDTSMALPIAWAALRGADLRKESVQDQIVADWVAWTGAAKDVGIMTRAVLGAVAREPSAVLSTEAARDFHDRTGRSGGNGSLMRTAPVALAFLHDADALVEAASAISALTHFDPEAGEACVLWCLAIRHAVLHGEFDLRGGLSRLPEDRAAVWSARIDDAEANPPAHFQKNGWVVHAFQAAWAAISGTPVPTEMPARHLQLALENAVRCGNDTDTVAAIAGGLLGARWGASAVPLAWQRVLHGWPHDRDAMTGATLKEGTLQPRVRAGAAELMGLATLVVSGANPDLGAWPNNENMRYRETFPDTDELVRHPFDQGVWLSGADALDHPPADVTAVVSLCRIGRGQTPPPVAPENHVTVWLLDENDPAKNQNLDHVLVQAADAVAALRAEGHTVLLHCVAAHSRTPTVASLYAARHRGIEVDHARRAVVEALTHAAPQRTFDDAVRRLAPTPSSR